MKKVEFYCVVGPDGKPRLQSSNQFRGFCIRAFLRIYTWAHTWEAAKKEGYTVEKFTLKKVKTVKSK